MCKYIFHYFLFLYFLIKTMHYFGYFSVCKYASLRIIWTVRELHYWVSKLQILNILWKPISNTFQNCIWAFGKYGERVQILRNWGTLMKPVSECKIKIWRAWSTLECIRIFNSKLRKFPLESVQVLLILREIYMLRNLRNDIQIIIEIHITE